MKKQIEEQVFDLLESTGLNWTVTKEPLVSGVDGKKSDSFGLFRKDTGLHLDTVTDRYSVLQNHEVARALIEATAEIDLTTNRGGQLDGGKHIYLQAALPDEYIGKSALQRYITGLNTHGSKSAAFGSVNFPVVCKNTFYMAFGQLTKYRHTASIQERVKEFVIGVRKALGLETHQIEVFKIMADQKVGDAIIARLMKNVFDVNMDAKQEDLTKRNVTKLASITDAIQEEFKAQGATVWGLFNGITRYTNHVAGQAKKTKTPEELLTYTMVGEGYEINLKAYQTIHDWLIEQKLIQPLVLEELD